MDNSKTLTTWPTPYVSLPLSPNPHSQPLNPEQLPYFPPSDHAGWNHSSQWPCFTPSMQWKHQKYLSMSTLRPPNLVGQTSQTQECGHGIHRQVWYGEFTPNQVWKIIWSNCLADGYHMLSIFGNVNTKYTWKQSRCYLWYQAMLSVIPNLKPPGYKLFEPTKTTQLHIFYDPDQSMRTTPEKSDHELYHPVTIEIQWQGIRVTYSRIPIPGDPNPPPKPS